MKYKVLADMIERGRAQSDIPLRFFFRQELKGLSHAQLKQVISSWADCFGTKPKSDELDLIAESIEKEKSYVVSDVKLTRDKLIKFLACVTLSEYRMGDITLHPPDMRFRELKEISKMSGLSQKEVLKIDAWWQEKSHGR